MMHCKCRRLDGHGAIVTGAGCSQIGRAIALRLAQVCPHLTLCLLTVAKDLCGQRQCSTVSCGLGTVVSRTSCCAELICALRQGRVQLSLSVHCSL